MNFSDLVSNQPAHILWLIAGVSSLAIGMLIAEPTLSALGIAGIITAIASLTINELGVQLLIWGILSVALAIVFRGLVPRESKDLLPAVDAEVSQLIPKGGAGEVCYEGSYWSARCQISDIAIDAGQIVQVVGRQGNTLIVLPTTFPNDDDLIFDQKT